MIALISSNIFAFVTMREKYKARRSSILQAAEREFLHHGYSGTTMDAVAQSADVTKQTVYRFFASKAALFETLIVEMKEDGSSFSFGDGEMRDELVRFGEAFLASHMNARKLEFYRLMVTESRQNSELGHIFRTKAQPTWLLLLTEYLAQQGGKDWAQSCAPLFTALLLKDRPSILMGFRKPLSKAEIGAHARFSAAFFLHGAHDAGIKKPRSGM